MTAHDGTSAARIIAGRYRLGPRLGSGLDAAVFEAFDEELQRSVIMKLVHPDLSDMPEVQHELRVAMPAAVALHHPNVAGVFDWGTAQWNSREVIFVVTERLAGGSLRDILDRGRLLTPSQALVVGLDACKALDAIHREGLVHTDIRPSTLVFGDERRLRVVDVGLAQVLYTASGGLTARSNDRAKYCSPEQAQGFIAQPKSDVYSLCLTLLESTTGRVPFEGDSTVATLGNRVDKLMPVSADLGALAAVLERAGRPHIADRYTAAEFGRALVQAAEKMARPAPLPILANSLFAPDRGSPDQPVDPTGPMLRPEVPPEVAAPALAPIIIPPIIEAESMPEPEPMPALLADPTPSPPLHTPLPTTLPPTTLPPTTLPPTTLPPTTLPPTTLPPTTTLATTAPATTPPPPPPPPTTQPVVAPVPVAPPIEVPAAVPMPSDDADLNDAGEEIDPDDEFPEHPAPLGGGRRWFLAALVVMAGIGGTLAWYNSRPDTSEIPNLAGLEEGVALNQVAGTFKPIVAQEPSETVDAGLVTRSEPVAGATLEHDKELTIFVSTGPAPRVLPDLVGLTVVEASIELTKMGLVLSEGEAVFDEEVIPGVVVSWMVPDSPALTTGGTVTKGTTVQVVASAGPAPRTVPDLTNLTLADATAALQTLRLLILQDPDEFSTTVPAGQVIRQDPIVGTTVERGATITVVLSKGPDLIEIPGLAGLDYNGIVAALQAAGFTIGKVQGNPAFAFIGMNVNGELAIPGMDFLRGTTVDLFFSYV